MLAQLRSWLAKAAECAVADDRRSTIAAVELTQDGHPARRLIEDLKNDHRHRLAALCRAAGIAEPEILADTLTLLFEGARVSHQAAGSKGPSAEFIRTAEAVIESFKAKSGPKRKPASRAR